MVLIDNADVVLILTTNRTECIIIKDDKILKHEGRENNNSATCVNLDERGFDRI